MNKNAIFAAAIVAACTFSSCKDDVVKAKRLDGTWTVNDYVLGTQDIVPTFEGADVSVTFVFDKDGDFTKRMNISYEYYGYSYNYEFNFDGTWEETSDGDLQLNFSPTSAGAMELEASFANYYFENYGVYTETYDIIELTKDNLDMQALINDNTVIVRATKQ